MPLDRRFVDAKIEQQNTDTWVLTITYSFYTFYNFDDVRVFPTLEQAKNKLLIERCPNLLIIDEAGKLENLKN